MFLTVTEAGVRVASSSPPTSTACAETVYGPSETVVESQLTLHGAAVAVPTLVCADEEVDVGRGAQRRSRRR